MRRSGQKVKRQKRRDADRGDPNVYNTEWKKEDLDQRITRCPKRRRAASQTQHGPAQGNHERTVITRPTINKRPGEDNQKQKEPSRELKVGWRIFHRKGNLKGDVEEIAGKNGVGTERNIEREKMRSFSHRGKRGALFLVVVWVGGASGGIWLRGSHQSDIKALQGAS